MSEELRHYSEDRSRCGGAAAGAHSGAAGGAACGDLVRISLSLEGPGRVGDARWQAEGCATARAAAAALCELVEGAELGAAARLGAEAVERELGGLSAVGRHGADLAADALHRALGAAALSGDPLAPAPSRGRRVLVAMSGGVDSAAAAHLERASGAEVWAVTLELWSDPANDGEASCCSPHAVRLARSVAHGMGLPHLTVDLRERFRAGVVDHFLAGYAAGRTPNPCVRCNGEIRLEPMIAIAGRLGAEALATGHYARLVDDSRGPLLAPGADPGKDQSYMLAGLAPELLRRLRFPLGELTKRRVRELAAAASIPVAGRAESQDLCFLAGEGKLGFLERHGGLAERRGEIVDRGGRRLGRHRGHHRFTVGQRRGIGVAAAEPLYVVATEPATNRVVVGTAAELEVGEVPVEAPVLHRSADEVRAVRLRYRAPAIGCTLRRRAPEGAILDLDRPVRRPAPGQTAVLIDGAGRIVGTAPIA